MRNVNHLSLISDVVQNRFISLKDESYIWNSKYKGPIVNNALNLEDFPNVKRLMDKVNTEFNCSLNSALVAYYKNGEVSARLHSDDEASLDSS